MQLRDTIAAISTPPGHGGIGVVRISGECARSIAEAILRFGAPVEWRPWASRLAELTDFAGEVLDQVVASYFAGPRSYTGEDIVEISCHGAPVILRHALERACQAGARLAEPGEFTLRGYLNGRLDLPRAEAVRDLIGATTLYQAKVAASQAGGALSRRIQPIKDKLVELIALLEAGIDFAEDDISVAPREEIVARLDAIAPAVRALVDSFRYGRLVHDGFTLAIVGKPNAGKSSLFNRLLEQDRAIVTDIAGTTRDTVSETASIEGIPVRLVDTAGIRQSSDLVESLGIERSYQAMADADLTLVVVDLADPADEPLKPTGPSIVVGNKRDVAPSRSGIDVEVSALTGAGIAELRSRILDALAPNRAGDREGAFLTSLRHKQALTETLEALDRGRQAASSGVPHEMLLLDLYAALQGIDQLTGATTADDILHRIFSTFCIGK